MSDRLVSYNASVVSGRGIARDHVAAEYNDFRQATGEELFLGSLNLVLAEPVLLNRDTAVSTGDSGRLLWQARLQGMSVWVYRYANAPLHVAEILSPVKLRDALDLTDGDTVDIVLSKRDIVPLSRRRQAAWRLLWRGRGHWAYQRDWYYWRFRTLAADLGATQKPIRRGVVLSILKYVIRGFR